MPDEEGPRQLQRVEHLQQICTQAGHVVPALGDGGATEAAPAHAQHPPTIEKRGREIVEDVSGVAEPGEQDDRRPVAAPVQHLQRDPLAHVHRSHEVWSAGLDLHDVAITAAYDLWRRARRAGRGYNRR